MFDDILSAIIDAGGVPYEVGGCVRDSLLGIESKDVDIEVFHLSADQLQGVLKRFGRVFTVGVSFGVLKLRTRDGTDYDFTLPRRDNKTGRGHKGFEVVVDHTMSFREAAARRDFTINSIGRECRDGKLVDPYGGIEDLERRVLKATSEHFAEDPLRVLRGMQFAARFDLAIDDDTAEMCRTLQDEFDTLAVERIWGEWHKWATRSTRPSRGLEVLERTGWLALFPELAALVGVPQDPERHPEGDVWVHTGHVCDAAALIAERDNLSEDERVILMFAALCHDLGKATTTELLDGRYRALGHCEAGVPLTRAFLEAIGCPQRPIDVIEPMVQEHLVHSSGSDSPPAVRRLSCRLSPATIEQLVRLVEADQGGRPPLPGGIPESLEQIRIVARELDVDASRPQPIVMGRHLIELGHTPGPRFRPVLDRCFEAQLDGEFDNLADGITIARRLIAE